MNRRKVLLFVAALIAAVGTMLVFLYVRGADARADARYDSVQVLRVVAPIASGESVEAAQAAGKLATSTISSKDLLPGALVSAEALAGKIALTELYPGEQVVEAKFGEIGSETELDLPAGKIAISINLDDPARVAGFLDPGDKVAIFMNGTVAGSGEQFTRLLLRSVQVIGLGATSATMNAAPADPEAAAPVDELSQALLTLGVTQAEAERVFFASRNGELSLALLDDESQVAKGESVTLANLFD